MGIEINSHLQVIMSSKREMDAVFKERNEQVPTFLSRLLEVVGEFHKS